MFSVFHFSLVCPTTELDVLMTLLFRTGFKNDSWRKEWLQRDVPPGSTSMKCVSSQNDALRLGIRKDAQGQIKTGSVGTQDTFSFQYGYVEARMRFMSPQGAHSALWLQTDQPYATPTHTEVNVVEHFGKDSVWHNVYWSENGLPPQKGDPSFQSKTTMNVTGWHVYGCDIRESGYLWTIDDRVVAGTNVGLSDQEHYLILSFLSDDWERDKLAPVMWPYRTLVDYVKVEG